MLSGGSAQWSNLAYYGVTLDLRIKLCILYTFTIIPPIMLEKYVEILIFLWFIAEKYLIFKGFAKIMKNYPLYYLFECNETISDEFVNSVPPHQRFFRPLLKIWAIKWNNFWSYQFLQVWKTIMITNEFCLEAQIIFAVSLLVGHYFLNTL